MTIESMVEEGDLVVALVRSEGTEYWQAPWDPATHWAPHQRRQSHWVRVADGRLAEHWATREDLPAMMQLCVIALPGPPEPPAT